MVLMVLKRLLPDEYIYEFIEVFAIIRNWFLQLLPKNGDYCLHFILENSVKSRELQIVIELKWLVGRTVADGPVNDRSGGQ